MTTIAPIRKRTTRVELSGRDIALLESAVFDALVRLLKDTKGFDITNPEDDAYLMECRMEADILKQIQAKLLFARKMMEAEA